MSQADSSSQSSDSAERTAEAENRFHRYRGNTIPWYVRLMWLAFWIFAVVYTIRFLFPALRREFFEQ